MWVGTGKPGGAAERFLAAAARYDARSVAPGGGVRIEYGAVPASGDTVVIWDGERVRVAVYDEVVRPFRRVRVLGVVREG